MIYDAIENLTLYPLSANGVWPQICKFAAELTADLAPGHYELRGREIYANIQEYITNITNEESRYEYHRQYIDIQMVLSGEEKICVYPMGELSPSQEYTAETDCGFYAFGNSVPQSAILRPGNFIVFLPEELHAPCQALNAPVPVKKAVIKIHRNVLE